VSGALLQEIAVGAIVLGAVGFLVWRRVRRRARPSPLCGDCPACAAAEERKEDWAITDGGGTGARRGARVRRG
jgi:hypothetical protein